LRFMSTGTHAEQHGPDASRTRDRPAGARETQGSTEPRADSPLRAKAIAGATITWRGLARGAKTQEPQPARPNDPASQPDPAIDGTRGGPNRRNGRWARARGRRRRAHPRDARPDQDCEG